MTTANEKPSSKATLNEPHASSHLKLSNCVKLSTQKSHKKQDKLAMHNRIQQVCRKMPKSPSDLSFSDYINGKNTERTGEIRRAKYDVPELHSTHQRARNLCLSCTVANAQPFPSILLVALRKVKLHMHLVPNVPKCSKMYVPHCSSMFTLSLYQYLSTVCLRAQRAGEAGDVWANWISLIWSSKVTASESWSFCSRGF